MSTSPLICATHYFADCGVANFWSTFRIGLLHQDLRRISDDGFTHIILVVPWALFQPSIEKSEIDEKYAKRLDTILSVARTYNLKVIFRLGFLWEICPVDQRTFYRFRFFFERIKLQRAWDKYFTEMYSRYAQNPVFEFAFVSWEDWYWSLIYEIGIEPAEKRLDLAEKIGFRQFLKSRHCLEELNALYSCSFQNWAEVSIPVSQEPLYQEYLMYFDIELSERLFASALAAFPGLQYEFRVDTNSVQTEEGLKSYNWARQRKGCTRPIIYYHANIGSTKEPALSTDTAITKLENLVKRYSDESAAALPFIDQFNFFNNHPDNLNTSKMRFSEIPAFVRESTEILKSDSSGYGIWGYRDWPNEKTYNGAFEFGSAGWLLLNHQGERMTSEEVGSLTLLAGMQLRQDVYYDGTPTNAEVLLEVHSDRTGRLGIQLDESDEIPIEISPGKTDYYVSFKVPAKDVLTIKCYLGPLRIHRVSLYSHVYTSGMYTRDLKERPPVSAIRDLNRALRG